MESLENLKINIISDVKNTDIIYRGEHKRLITTTDMNTFGINLDIIRDAVARYFKQGPTDIYLYSPTPWGDLYKTYNWEQVHRHLHISKATLKNVVCEQEFLKGNTFKNNFTTRAKVNASLTHTIENTLTTIWSYEKETSVTPSFDIEIAVKFFKVSAGAELSFTNKWGKSETHTQTVTVGSVSGFEVDLDPKQSVTTTLEGEKCYLEIGVEYVEALTGKVAVNFANKCQGHHFYGIEIGELLKLINKSDVVTKSIIIKVDYCYNTLMKLTDAATGAVM